ncbi:MAG: hypothetical protein RLZZ276_1159 [Pseudomonadota bacterium]|jgi:soluble lytic murein transglycosylase-like protein
MLGRRRNTSRRAQAASPISRTAILVASLAGLLGFLPDPAHAQVPVAPEAQQDAAGTDSAAIFRLGPHVRPANLSLPQPLEPADASAYREAFAAAGRGNLRAASHALERVGDTRLAADVRAEYLLSPEAKPRAAEFAGWLRDNPDHRDVPAIRAAATALHPGAGLDKPASRAARAVSPGAAINDLGPGKEARMPPGRSDLSRKDAGARDRLRARLLASMRAAELDKAEAAVRSAEARRLLTEGEQDHFLTRIAAGLFARDDEAGALRISREAAARSNAPRAYWVAGLAAFALEDFASAAGHFEDLARLPRAHAWEVSAAGFWAARSHLRAKRFDRVDPWLEVAAKHPRSFYGLLAIRSLGRGMPFNWEMPETTQEQIVTLQRHPAGQRGFMLLQAGQQARAEAEFARLAEAAPRDQRTALFAVALRANLSGLAARLGRDSGEDTRPFDSSAYPIPPWQPSEGFAVDPALVYAFIRQESRFDPRAVSPAGARGLMQLMPRTAAMLNGGPVRNARLHDPSFNMTLGQRYLQQLLESEPVGGDLIRLAASYNAGPGTVVRWKQRRDQRDEETREDALLAIETLPSPETRHFITRVLYSYWMYSERMGQPAPSLDAVAQGAWPSYVPPVSLTARAIGPNAKDR